MTGVQTCALPISVFPNIITFYYKNLFELDEFRKILAILDYFIQNYDQPFYNLHLGVLPEAWQTDLFFKSGSRDKFLYSFWDPEIALQERNVDGLEDKSKTKQNYYQPNFSKIIPRLYFYLTPIIEENDFRLEYLSKAFHNPLLLR